MIIFPAIDLKGGQCVRLAEGDMDRATIYADDPGAQAKLFADAGAKVLHVVDLAKDAAHVFQAQFALGCQAHAARGPVDQWNADA